jgi:hypothetical protein
VIDRTGEIRSTRAPKLREDQLEVLKRYGQTRTTEVGEVLFRAGDTSNDFIVVLEGEVEVIDDFAGETRTVGSCARAVCRWPLRFRAEQKHEHGGLVVLLPQLHCLSKLKLRDRGHAERSPCGNRRTRLPGVVGRHGHVAVALRDDAHINVTLGHIVKTARQRAYPSAA